MKIFTYTVEGDAPAALRHAAAMVFDGESAANWWCHGPTAEGAAAKLQALYEKERAHYDEREGKKPPPRKKKAMEAPLGAVDPGDVI